MTNTRKPNNLHTLTDDRGYGLWLWKTEEGGILSDGEGNVLNVPGTKHDINAMIRIKRAATYYGFPNGEPVFKPNAQRLTEMQWEYQMEKLIDGELSPWDYPGLIDEAKQAYLRKNR